MNRALVMTALVAVSMAATPALAANFSLSSTDESSGTSWFTAPHIGNGGYVWVSNGPPIWGGYNKIVPLSFDHTLTFNIAADSLINVNLWQSESGITFDNVFLNGVSLASNLTPGTGSMPGFSIGEAYAEAGTVTLRFIGQNIGNPHSFGGTLNIAEAAIPPVTAAIPEPVTWAMMIAGFGLVGAAMRRRSTKVKFAT